MPDAHPPAPAAPVGRCASCGATLTGRFCPNCGAPAAPGECAACHASLSPGARFCHRCGAPTRASAPAPGRERAAWVIAGVAALIAIAAVAWRAGGAFRPTVPEMGNAGNAGEAGSPTLATRAPDISAMSPRERFDRLFDRIMRAAESGDSVTVVQFGPMAISAYGMLDSVNIDARYHAAMLHLAMGELPAAAALADSILTEAPGHLFGYVVRGEVAERRNRSAELTASYRDFLAHYDAEMKLGRVEYGEHRPVLDNFRTRARASLGQ
jgi:double zinc ribbon protein